MTKPNIYFVVNQRLTYVSTQLLLEWAGVAPREVLFCSYYDVEEKLDEFLFEYVNTDKDVVFLIGFDKEISNNLIKIYEKYKFKPLISDVNEDGNIFGHTFKKLLPKLKGNLSEEQKYYIKCVNDLINNNFSNKDAYILGIIFYKVSPEKFYEHYKDGFKESGVFNTLAVKHIKLFNKEDHTLYEYRGYYFVLSTIKYMGDYIYKFHDKIDNLSIIDLRNKRVYMKNLKKSGKDINILCKKFCENVRGFTDFCSGDMTEDFLKLTKKMEKVD